MKKGSWCAAAGHIEKRREEEGAGAARVWRGQGVVGIRRAFARCGCLSKFLEGKKKRAGLFEELQIRKWNASRA